MKTIARIVRALRTYRKLHSTWRAAWVLSERRTFT
jgi:hypothetical protein